MESVRTVEYVVRLIIDAIPRADPAVPVLQAWRATPLQTDALHPYHAVRMGNVREATGATHQQKCANRFCIAVRKANARVAEYANPEAISVLTLPRAVRKANARVA